MPKAASVAVQLAVPVALLLHSCALAAQGPGSAAARFDFGAGAAAGAGPFSRTATLEDALDLHWTLSARMLSRQAPLGLRLEFSENRPVSFFEAEAASASCPPVGSCEPGRTNRTLVRSLVASASWGVRAGQSGAYAVAGTGAYRTRARDVTGTYLGVNYGVGLTYFERRGSNSFYVEARRHQSASSRVGSFVPIVLGVIF